MSKIQLAGSLIDPFYRVIIVFRIATFFSEMSKQQSKSDAGELLFLQHLIIEFNSYFR